MIRAWRRWPAVDRLEHQLRRAREVLLNADESELPEPLAYRGAYVAFEKIRFGLPVSGSGAEHAAPVQPASLTHEGPRHVIPHTEVLDFRSRKELAHGELIGEHDTARVVRVARLVSAPEVVERGQSRPRLTHEGYGAHLAPWDEGERVVIEVPGKHGECRQF